MSFVRELKTKLFYHERLISMMSDKSLPIKNVLLNDIKDMRHVLERAKKEEKSDVPRENHS